MQAGRIGKPVDGFDHVKVTTTLKIYTHQFKTRDAAAATMMGDLVESALRGRTEKGQKKRKNRPSERLEKCC
ncbi:MAG: hypothetical protein II702_06880 [Clostridia bacterium]|nr:hypothetical protein [Clostridia bacterium]